ncbi:MAG: phosphoenolpyruvate synthase [Candidatus Methanomethylicaceae archaeon]|nr:phosphoenolpyruvate synthase [Candidatus Verstraetearchaeota archaeon]
MSIKQYVIPFEQLRKSDVILVGGKNANLGELISIGIPVPPGFAITAEAYKAYIEYNNLSSQIFDLLSKVDVLDSVALEETSSKIRKIIESGKIPEEIEIEIINAYRELGKKIGKENPSVAVRSSATAEDLPNASFAGQQETYLFVEGEESLLKYVKKCFSSLYTPRAITYRRTKGFDDRKVYLSVGVQKMVNSKASGVMFTLDPVTGDRDVIVIEGTFGVGETIVQGRVRPDQFVVDKKSLTILKERISQKSRMAIRASSDFGEGLIKEVPVPEEMREKPCITKDQVVLLARYAIEIEKHYGIPMDIEWALDSDDNRLYILQARPETVWSQRIKIEKPIKAKAATPILKGLPASPGIVSGPARVILDVKDAHQLQTGEILVTHMTSPDWGPTLKKAKAIVTNSGGITCHAAIVSRELGIPCIVGTVNATSVIKTGQIITVDATHGVVYDGEVIPEEKEEIQKIVYPETYIPTATKILMNLGEPSVIEKYKDLPFDGIGLMRIEFIIADIIGEHPLQLIENGKEDIFIEKLAEGIAQVARAIHPRPVIVRFSDFKTNEYRQLKSGEKYEPIENNPMLGWRGVSRYISKEYEPAFRLECRAIKRVRDILGLKNVHVMLPFVRTTWEVEKCLEIMKNEGLERNRDFKVWLMAEVPSIIFMADEFAKLCDGFSIGSNDLTQLILGVDRDSPILPKQDSRYFDERDSAVLRAISHLIKVAHKYGRTVSICGQGPSVYPELTEFLVRCGIDSISVNPDAVIWTRKIVASIERKIVLEKAIKKNDELKL